MRLMDIMMPEMNGYETTKAIRNMPDRPDGKKIPIIYSNDSERICRGYTGSFGCRDGWSCGKAGRYGYVTVCHHKICKTMKNLTV